MSKLELILLGRFECLLSSGTRISLSMRKAEVLLAFLALTPGLRHPRERLINLLWSDRGEEQARNSLRQCLSAIRKSLGDAADLLLQIDRTTVCLNSELIEIDANEFERLAAIGDYESLVTAADLYQGEFLEGISIRDAACQDWLDGERARFRRQFIEILINLAETQLLSHDYRHAIHSAERLVKQDPLNEPGWRLLMRSYADNGDRNYALQAFKRCEQTLRNELDIGPESTTLELREQIIGGEAKTKPVAASEQARAAPTVPTVSTDHSIAVLPFDNLSGDPEQEYFSDGITDSITLNLSLFPGLNVKSRNSSFAFKQQIKSLGEISRELEVDYIVEGSIRRSADRIRITVQLIEAASGNQVWGKRYDAELDNLFDLEEQLSRSIAATVTGQIESDLQRIAVAKGAAGQQSYDLLLSGLYHAIRFNNEDSLIAIEKLNQCLAQDPDNVRAHVYLYSCHSMSYLERWTEDYRASFSKAAEHIKRALALNPESALVQAYYAEYLIFNDEADKAGAHLDKALQINPNDTDALSVKAFLLENIGEFEAALEFIDRSLQLDPYHPWAEWELAVCNYYSGHYEAAIQAVDNARTSPSFTRIFSVAANLKLGRPEPARQALRTFLAECRQNMKSMPQNLDEWTTYVRDNYMFKDPGLNESLMDCLRQAGIEQEIASPTLPREQQDYPAILVLPFANLSGDPDQEYFSDGITESIILSLGSFSGIQVKSRHTSIAFRDSTKDIDQIGNELGVQYIVEGSIRKLGENVRTTVQLVDTVTGNQIWGKRYDSSLEDLFALEEELVQTIAGAVSARVDRVLRATSLHKPARDLKSYDYLMRGWHHAEKFNPEDYALSIEYLKKCVELDPDNGQAHAILTGVINLLLYENWSTDREATRREADYHINRALEIDRSDALAHAFMSEHQMLQHNLKMALYHAEQSIENNPALPDGYSAKAMVLSYSRKHEEAVKLAEFSLQMDPYHFYMAWNASIVFRHAGEYQKSIDAFRTLAYPSPGIHAELAASLVGLGELEEAREEMARFKTLAREQMPSYPASSEDWRVFWRDVSAYQFEEDFDAFFDQMQKAGLCDDIARDPNGLPSIAVLPFENMSGDLEQEYFCDGITASIVLSMGMFKGLMVKSQKSSFAFKNSADSSREIGEALGVDYLVEGSIRRSETKIRISVQLVEAASGNQLWGKQYDTETTNLLNLEQELSQTIAATISGRIGSTIQAASARKPATNLKSYDYFLRGLHHFGKLTRDDLAFAIEQFEKCIAIDPDNAEAHMNLGMIHDIYLYENWTADRDSAYQQADIHMKKAVELAPDNAMIHAYLSEHLLNMQNVDEADFHADRAIELNPNSSEAYAAKAQTLSKYGRYDEAVESAERSVKLDPYSSGAAWVAGETYLFAGQYENSVKAFRSIDSPPNAVRAGLAASLAATGQLDQARREMQQYLENARRDMVDYPESPEAWREVWQTYTPFVKDEEFETFFGLLLKAGLYDDIAGPEDDMPSIAVLPFDNMSGEAEQEHFSDGITADIISTLSKFPHLRTVSRYSTLQYKAEKLPIADIAQQQKARYILEGSVRKSGNHIRVNAELIDSADGQILWNERYDRDLDDLFAVQDEITQQIALAMKVHLDDGDMAVHRSGTDNIRAWELVLAAIDLQDTYIRKNIVEARVMAQKAIELDPDYAYAWICLAWTYWQEVYSGWSESVDASMEEATRANQRALELNPEYSEAWSQAGAIYMINQDADRAVESCRKAVKLEPGNAETQALAAYAYIFTGEYELAREHIQQMQQLCPVLPNWYYSIAGQVEQYMGNLDAAVQIMRRGIEVEPDSPLCRFYLINVMMELGDEATARNLADEIRSLDREVVGRGFVRAQSADPAIRKRFRGHLEKFDLY